MWKGGKMLKIVVWGLVIVMGLLWVKNDPAGAAHTVKALGSGLGSVASGLGKFASNLSS